MKSVIICDMEGVIQEMNQGALNLFGYNKDELIGKKRVSIFSNKSTHQIAFRAANNSVTITTEDPEKASKAQETIDIEYDGDSIDVGYNAAYLKDILAHMKSDKIVVKLNQRMETSNFQPIVTSNSIPYDERGVQKVRQK